MSGSFSLAPAALARDLAQGLVSDSAGELAIRLRIPSITQAKALMERGLLISYGAD